MGSEIQLEARQLFKQSNKSVRPILMEPFKLLQVWEAKFFYFSELCKTLLKSAFWLKLGDEIPGIILDSV